VNVRSFQPDNPRSREFVYGVTTAEETLAHVVRLSGEGLFTIVNETVDVSDGGVSGVIQGGIIEFAPDDTPRCVEKAGVASLPLELGMRLLETVYGFRPDFEPRPGERVEFSIHPKPRGWKGTHTLLWEWEEGVGVNPSPSLVWPNRFSEHLGDKAYGLLMAEAFGADVPRTTVIGRRVAPFSFGRGTGSLEVWTRTCPATPRPGLYTTTKGWTDPFRLLAAEDLEGTTISSVLCQAAVPARFSGAAIIGGGGELIVEGRRGEGDLLMLGRQPPEQLPKAIVADVKAANSALATRLGPVRIEWVHDGSVVWIVQMHRGATNTEGDRLVPGEADEWIEIDTAQPLEVIRQTLERVPEGSGVQLLGEIGLTSHVADLVRKRGAPARLRRSASSQHEYG
jgi:hypothetical protein